MTKADLAGVVAKSVEGLTKKKSGEIVDEVFALIEETIAKGEKVQIVSFGTFEVQHRKARQGRNPQDPKKIIHIPEKTVPLFRAGRFLKELVAK